VCVTEWGPVKILAVKANANTKALTLEEIEGQRKGIVMNMVKLLDSALGQELDAKALKPECLARVEADSSSSFYFNDHDFSFIPEIKTESKGRVAVYEAKAGVWFANNAHLGKAVADGLALPGLAMGKFNLWMDDTSLNLKDTCSLNFQTAHLRGMQRRERLLAEAEAAGDGATVTALALEDCVAQRYITDAASLENPDEISGETALITQSFLGEVAVATRLLQAGANSNALILEGKERAGETALLFAAREGHADIVKVLIDFKADLAARDPKVFLCTLCVCVYICTNMYTYVYIYVNMNICRHTHSRTLGNMYEIGIFIYMHMYS